MSKSTSGDNSYPNFDNDHPVLGKPLEGKLGHMGISSTDSVPTGEPVEGKLGDMGISELVNQSFI